MEIFWNIFFNPSKAFVRATNRHPISLLIPILLSISFTTILNIYYYSHVNFEWLSSLLTSGFPPEQRDAVKAAMSRDRLILFSVISVVVTVAALYAGRSALFWLILQMRGQATSYGKLFAVVSWSALPLLLILPAGLLSIGLDPGGRIGPSDINPVSANQLLFHMPSTEGWGRLWSTITVVGIWELWLHSVGLKTVSGVSTRSAMTIALTPVLLVYGVWAMALTMGGLTR